MHSNIKTKRPVLALYIFNIFILLSGVLFIIYSVYFNITFKVLNTKFPAFIFGLSVLYFAFKNFNSLKALNKTIKKSNLNFSWKNFSKSKKTT